MPDTRSRREVLADAGIEVLARSGVRGLTHRAVDGAAGLPRGSASYHARTRDALVALIVQRLADLDLGPRAQPEGPWTRERLAAHLAASVSWQASGGRTRTAARYALLLASAPGSPAAIDLQHGRSRIREALLALLAGVAGPGTDAVADDIIALCDGSLLRALTTGEAVDQKALGRALLLLMGAGAEDSPGRSATR